MSDQQVIAAKLEIDSGNSNQQIKDVKTSVDGVNASLKDTQKTAKDAGKEIQTQGENFANLKEKIASLPGPLGDTAEGVGKVDKIFKVLVANPIVATITAIVAGLAFLYKAFTNTFEGGEKVEQVFAGIKAAIGEVLDRILAIGGAIIKFFSGDFKGAFEDAKKAVTGVGDAIVDTYNKVSLLTKTAQQLHKEQLQNDLDQAERAKQLAILREKASDADTSVQDRLKALQDLKKAAEQNAKDDIDLAKRTADNKIALLSIGTDAVKKNQDEINKIRINQINVETENANELRRIDKQITSAQKQEQAERKQAETDAANHAKEERQKLLDFTNTLLKLQQENDLLSIKDGYQKEQAALEQKIANEKKTNEQALKDKKLTRDQFNQIDQALDLKAQLERDALTEKHKKEVATKEEDFQKELNGIQSKTRLDGISNQRELEKVQLQITYEQNLQDAIKRYQGDADKLFQIKQALDAQYKAEQAKIDEKNKKEDDKKRFQLADEAQKKIIDDRTQSTNDRIAAIDADLELTKAAFDSKVLNELEYNKKVDDLTKARNEIRKQETANALDLAGKVAQGFDNLSTLVGKQTAAGKAFSVAAATISAIQGAVQSFTSLSAIPIVGPALGIVAAAAALAAGYANVKKILAVQVPGQSTASPSLPSGSTASIPAAPVAPTVASTAIDQASINNFGSAVTPGRAYVLDADVQNNADRNARLNRAARLGG